MLGKLLGKKKKGNYFLELSEEEMAAIPEPSEAPAPKVAAPEANGSAAPEATPAPAKAAAPAAAAPAATKAAAAMPQEVATPVPVSDPIEIIRTAIAASAKPSESTETAPVETFDYTTPLAKPRRRPGPSMSPFKSMAKDMRKSSAGF